MPPWRSRVWTRSTGPWPRSAPLAGLRLQGLDLRGRAAALLARTDLEGLVVLGGQLTP